MNTGFSWVRIDKGNIHCNFRYLNVEQVETVTNYLKSYYEYNNVTVSIIDLGAQGILPESGDHYRPSDDDPNQDYYFLVELHRHGTIIPQGCIEIMKTAINSLALHQIIPESVFIEKLKSNRLTVDDTATLTAVSTKSSGSDIQWATSDQNIISISPVASSMDCDIVAEGPGSAQIEASVTVLEEVPIELKATPQPSAYWVDNIYKYVGVTKTITVNGSPFTFTQNNYYECSYDNTVSSKYKWEEVTYSGNPVSVTYRDIYEMIVRTYIKIITKDKQRLCLYHFEQMEASTPSTGQTITWTSSSDTVEFDSGLNTGSQVTIVGRRVGSSILTAQLTDAYGTYTDSMTVTVFALDVTPSTIKMVAGATKRAVVAKDNIFSIASGVVVDWASSNTAIAVVQDVNPTDPTTDFAEVEITAQGVGQAFVTAVAEDPTDGTSYSDSVKVTVGNVAINVPASTVISLLAADHTLTLTCDLTAGFTVDASTGWTSGNPAVVDITSVSGTDNNTVVLTGLTAGTSLITVTGRNGSAVDTDQILIQVLPAQLVTMGEMKTFTHGQFNGHGVVDWNHPTGEEGTLEVEDTSYDLATEDEVEDFVDDLFDEDAETH